MSKVVIHIGTHKTATTTIQDMFWKNSRVLATHGLIYPRVSRRVMGHHGLVFNWVQMDKPYQLRKGGRAALSAIAEKYAQTDATVFLSSEEFSRGAPESATDFAELRDLLSAFDEIEIICVLRTQWQFLQSVYMEVSKKSMPPRPPALVNPVIDSGMFMGLWVDYNLLLDSLEKAFEPEQITLLDFDMCRQSDGGILGYLLHHLGVDIGVAALQSVNQGTSNISPMSLACWVANILSEPSVASYALVQRIEMVLRNKYGEDVQPCLFTHGEFRALKDHFTVKNRELQMRRAAVQPEFAITQASSEGLTLYRHEIDSPLWVQLGRSLVANPL
ncbi:hypothetical protein [Profundibacter sp.]